MPPSNSAVAEVERGADPTMLVGQVVKIPTSLVKRLPNQPRTYFASRALAALRDSIAEIGQQQPATVIPWNDNTFRIRDGERRLRCCAELKIPLLALVVDAKSEEEEFELSTVANMNRESHSPLEKALAMKRLRDGRLQRSVKEIARTFGLTETAVYNYLLVVDELPPEIIDLMDPNKQGDRARTLPLTVAIRLTALRSHPGAQIRLARRVVEEDLGMGAATRMIDEFADSRNITAGRGRERRPADHLDLLRTALRNAEQKIGYFAKLDQRQISEFFAFIPVERHEELVGQIAKGIDALTALAEKVNAVEDIGARRKGAA